MRAIAIHNFGEQLTPIDTPKPTPAEHEILVKVLYAAVNPVDWKICEGWLKELFPHHFPLIPGWDAVGIVESVGTGVTNFQPKDEIYAYCRKPEVQWGAYAEFITLDTENVALKPKNLNFAQASAIPLVGLTAWQALYDVGKLQKGESILIHAGAGGVGSMAIQLAKLTGAKIYTTASQGHHDYVQQLGAEVAIDYNKDHFASHIKLNEPKGVDMVFDCVGGQTLIDSLEIVKKGGRVVSIVEKVDEELQETYPIQFGYVFVRPSGAQLTEISTLFEEEKLITPHIDEMMLSDATLAHEKIKAGHTQGKIVLKIG